MLQIAIREAKRQNVAYRQHSVTCLAQICRARTDTDMSGVVLEVVEPVLVGEADGEPMEVDGAQSTSKADDV